MTPTAPRRYAPLLLASVISAAAVAGYFTGKTAQPDLAQHPLTVTEPRLPVAAAPTQQFADGSVYSGPVDSDHLAHGSGMLSWPDGRRYVGQFKAGQFHGAGRLTMADGSQYSGAFREGQFNGLGEFVTATGTRYLGQFKADAFTGEGTITYADGATHAGSFADWLANGSGIYVDSEGNQYQGEFRDDELAGTGTFLGQDGTFYQGEFARGYFSGQGRLYSPNGDLYLGQFRYDQPHGSGEWWSGSDPSEHYRGRWRRGRLISAEGNIRIHPATDIAEYALYHQADQLARTLATLTAGTPGTIEIFTLGLALYGAEEVFSRELTYLERHTAPQLSAPGHVIMLGNSRRNLERVPLATQTSIQQALVALGEKMNPEDILFIYLTSHGSRDGTVSIQQPGLQLADLSATRLRTLLDEARIPWRVLAISACFSGQFLAPLAAPNTLVMTAAAADRTSFGCSDDSDFTYFGKALLQAGLGGGLSDDRGDAAPASELDFVQAFHTAEQQITLWETTAAMTPSRPQLQAGEAILQQLARWRTTTDPTPAQREYSGEN